jgi:hypothetical protein
VTLTYERGERQHNVAVRLGDAPADAEIETELEAPFSNILINRIRLGVTIEQIDAEVKERLQLQRDEGVVIVEVMAGSAAERAGLQPNDIFLAIGETPIDTVDTLQRTLLSQTPNRPTELHVLRGSEEMTLTTTLASPLTLEGLGDILPPSVRGRILQQLEENTITEQELQRVLRLYRNRSENVRIGGVQEATPTELTLQTATGEEVRVAVTAQTELRRGSDVIRVADLRENELVMVLSMDGGVTAFSVHAFGVDAP